MFNYEFAADAFKKILINGLPITLLLVFLTVLISLPISFLLGLVRFKRIKGINFFLQVVQSFFKGTPLMILIFIFYNAIPDALYSLSKAYGWDFDVYSLVRNPFPCALLVCCTFTIAAMTDIFRSSLSAVNANQLEAAHSVGLSSFQAYIRIIIPQAIVSAIPNIENEVVGLIKGSSLLFYMTVQDIMGTAKALAGPGMNFLEAYVDVLIVYVILCFIVQKLFVLLEKKVTIY